MDSVLDRNPCRTDPVMLARALLETRQPQLLIRALEALLAVFGNRQTEIAAFGTFVRDQLARFLIEDQGDRLCAARAQVPALCSERPDAIPLSAKLRTSEYRRRLFQFALSLQGANAVRWVGDAAAVEGGKWQRTYFNSFSSTIGGGTSQIQANIVGERVLGLPKD